jgi:hypothetical protein
MRGNRCMNIEGWTVLAIVPGVLIPKLNLANDAK